MPSSRSTFRMLPWRGAPASAIAFALLFVLAVGCQPRGGPASGSPSTEDPVHEGRRVSDWIHDLDSPDGEKVMTACRAFRTVGPAAGAAAPELMRVVVETDNEIVRRAAEETLGALGPGAVHELRRALSDETCRARAVETLRFLEQGAAPLLPDLIRDLDRGKADRSEQARMGILNLALAGDPEGYRVLLQQVQNGQLAERTRLHLGRSLARFATDSAAADLVRLLDTGDIVTRRAALLGLVRSYPRLLGPACGRELAVRTSDADPACRIALAHVLGVCSTPEFGDDVPSALVRLAGDPVPEVRYAAARGLQHYNRDTRYERTDLARLERGLIQDSALGTFWMGGPTKYAAYF